MRNFLHKADIEENPSARSDLSLGAFPYQVSEASSSQSFAVLSFPFPLRSNYAKHITIDNYIYLALNLCLVSVSDMMPMSEKSEKQMVEGELARPAQNPLLLSEDLELYPMSITQAQFEALQILLVNKQSRTTKSIQRNIEYSYITHFLEEIFEEVNKAANKLLDERRRTYDKKIWSSDKNYQKTEDKILDEITKKRSELITAVIKKHGITEPLLKKEIDIFISESADSDNDGFAKDFQNFKNFMLTTDKYGNVESKRTKAVSAINKSSGYKIPSYETISKGLSKLKEDGYVDYLKKEDQTETAEIRTNASGLWSIADNFHKVWNQKRLSILEDYQKIVKATLDDTYHPVYHLVEKYGTRILDFYQIKIRERSSESLSPEPLSSVYLEHLQEVSQLVRD